MAYENIRQVVFNLKQVFLFSRKSLAKVFALMMLRFRWWGSMMMFLVLINGALLLLEGLVMVKWVARVEL